MKQKMMSHRTILLAIALISGTAQKNVWNRAERQNTKIKKAVNI
jgi:hypothetical protein